MSTISCFTCFSARAGLADSVEEPPSVKASCGPSEEPTAVLPQNRSARRKWRERQYPDYAVGIERPLQEVLELLEWKSDKNALAVLLHGLGGTGKTTLAEAVFARINIEGCRYSMVKMFDDIKTYPDIIGLQKCILKDLMQAEAEHPDIRTSEDGQREIGRILEREVAFIFIDNVLSEDPLERLLPKDMKNVKKLRLIMTARDKGVRRGCRLATVKYYAMENLPHREAVFLLEKEINDKRDTHKDQIISASQLNELANMCGGIPLVLMLVGRFIRYADDKQKAYCQVLEEIKSLDGEAFPDVERYVFDPDLLPYKYKDPFLDICSFFNGWDWDLVADIVGEYALDMLQRRALLSKSRDGTVQTHDIILALGLKKTMGTRLKFSDASASEIEDCLEEEEIRGLWYNNNVDPEHIPVHISAEVLDSIYSSLRIFALGNMIKVKGKCTRRFEELIFFQGEVPSLPFNLSHSKELRYLEYQPQDLNLSEMPTSLRQLKLDGKLQSTDVLEISSGDIQRLRNLRALSLINFAKLKYLPEDMGYLLNDLQELTLSYCISTEELPKSFLRLQSLKVLNMSHCSSLKYLPEDFGVLSSLQELILPYCETLEQLPASISHLPSLRVLNMSHCSRLKYLPEDFGELSYLQELILPYWETLEELPPSISHLRSLRVLNMSHCSSLKYLPEHFEELSYLQELILPYCETLEELPASISHLRSLRVLNINHCSSLKKLPEDLGSVSSLQELNLSYCHSIEELPESISELQSLKVLKIDHCSSLKQRPGFESFIASLGESDDADADCLS